MRKAQDYIPGVTPKMIADAFNNLAVDKKEGLVAKLVEAKSPLMKVLDAVIVNADRDYAKYLIRAELEMGEDEQVHYTFSRLLELIRAVEEGGYTIYFKGSRLYIRDKKEEAKPAAAKAPALTKGQLQHIIPAEAMAVDVLLEMLAEKIVLKLQQDVKL